MRSPLSLLLPVAFAVLALLACDDEDSPSPSDAGTILADAGADVRDAGHDGHDSGVVVDAGPPPIRCTAAELAANDRTDGGAFEITFQPGANPAQYENRCVTVKVGASVTFSGGFPQHPLQAAGGDSPNPIPYTAANPPGGKLVVPMPSAGTFGFECEFHPTLMYGAIRVVP